MSDMTTTNPLTKRPMSQLKHLQRQFTEIGRIRLGELAENGYPRSLETFRLTSADKNVLVQAADIWGGTVVPWAEKKHYYELVTNVSEIPILVAPQLPKQGYEFWQKGGCKRRCDGENCLVAKDGAMSSYPCKCLDEDGQQTEFGRSKNGCGLYTRIQVMLPDLQALGVWMLVTKSWYAAMEMPQSLSILRQMTECKLAIDFRESVKDDQTKKFVVPVIRINTSLRDVLALGSKSSGTLEPPQTALQLPSPTVESSETSETTETSAQADTWPVYDDPEADNRLKLLGFTPSEAMELLDRGIDAAVVCIKRASSKEEFLLGLEG